MRRAQANEDVTLAEAELRGAGGPAALLCVFDGHCGRRAAEQVAAALPRELGARLPAQAAELAAGRGARAAWEAAFQATDAGLTAEEGCTATALLAWRDASGATCLQARPTPATRHPRQTRLLKYVTAGAICLQARPGPCTRRSPRKTRLLVWEPCICQAAGVGLAAVGCYSSAPWLPAPPHRRLRRRLAAQAANVGDSAAFFAPFPRRRSAPPEVVPLTADHRVANPDERQRLEGGSSHHHPHHLRTPSLPPGQRWCPLPLLLCRRLAWTSTGGWAGGVPEHAIALRLQPRTLLSWHVPPADTIVHTRVIS